MPKNPTRVSIQQQPPELYGAYATYTRKGTAGFTVVPHPVTCPDPYDDETKEAYVQRKEDGLVHIGGPQAVRGSLAIVAGTPRNMGSRIKPRTSQNTKLVCDTCEDWWCSSANEYKARLHEAKKSGHKVG